MQNLQSVGGGGAGLDKASLRQAARQARAAQPEASGAVARCIGGAFAFAPGSAIALTWPLPGEIDLRPLLTDLHARGHRMLLPQTPPLGSALTFRRWSPGCGMIRERFGTSVPDGEQDVPDVIFVPLLAFDRAGGRLGYGGGYYDRTLAALPDCPRAGFGLAAQEVACVPMEPHDCRLPVVVTEQGVIRTSAAGLPAPQLRGDKQTWGPGVSNPSEVQAQRPWPFSEPC